MAPEFSAPRGVKSRLSFMMFLHFFSLGAVLPIFTLYATRVIGLSNGETGIILAAGSLATALAPLITSLIADKLISGRILLGGLNFLSAVFFFFLLFQKDFIGILTGYVLLMAAKGPTFALSNSITFQHLVDRERHFPAVRLWGTVGWISVGWFVSLSWLTGNAGSGFSFTLMLGALASLFLGFYALTLPKTPLFHEPKRPQRTSKKIIADKKRTWDGSLISFLVITVLISMVDKFYFYGAGIHASQLGIPDPWILPAMSLGQGVEVLAMALMGFFLPRWGFRKVFFLGIFWQVIRFAILSQAGVPGFFLLGVGFHGMCFAFFFANAFVYIDSRTLPGQRAKVHQLYMFLVEGLGVAAGNLGAGISAGFFSSTGVMDFSSFWLIPMAIALVCLLLLAVFFRPGARVAAEASDPGET